MLDVLRELRERLGMAIVLITHDLGVVADVADRVIVMYAGRKVEEAPVDELFAHPQHPYTLGLLGAVPAAATHAAGDERARLVEIPGMVAGAVRAGDGLSLRAALPARRRAHAQRGAAAGGGAARAPRGLPAPRARAAGGRRVSARAPVLEVADLEMHFPAGGDRVVHAVDGLSLSIAAGEVVGLVGESGSGKSTVGNCILRLVEPTGGKVVLHGEDITHLSARRLRPLRRRDAHGLPGSLRLAEPAHDHRRQRGRAAAHPRRRRRQQRPRPARRRAASTASGCARSCATAIRTSSPAASASASGSRGR